MTTAPKQLSTTQASLPPPEISKGPDKAGDQGQRVEVTKGKKVGQGSSRPESKRKGKEAKPLPKTKGPEAAPKANEIAPKSKEVAPKATIPPASQLCSKEDPPPTKA